MPTTGRLMGLVAMALFILGWSLVDVMKLLTRQRTQGQILNFRKTYRKQEFYYRAEVSFSLEEGDGGSHTYQFLSRYHFEENTQQYETVTVLYAAKDLANAELLMQIRHEAATLAGLSIFAIVAAVLIYGCGQCMRQQFLANNGNHKHQQSQEMTGVSSNHPVASDATNYEAMEDTGGGRTGEMA